MLTTDRSATSAADRSMGNDRDDPDATLAELRKDLASLVSDVQHVVEARAAAAKNAADVGLDATRDTIRKYPVASMATATLIGVAAAIALSSGAGQSRRTKRISDWSPHVTRTDLHEFIGDIKRTASRATEGAPLMSAFERVVDTVTSIDPKATLPPALEKAGVWLNMLRGNFTVK